MIEIASAGLRAAIDPFGAELSSLKGPDGRERMSDGDPAFWSGRAPLLFPIVGRLNAGSYLLGGRRFSMEQHGFARRQGFAVVEQAADCAVFRLTDNAETRAIYPFAFALDAAFTIAGAALTVAVTVENRGEDDMPASFGFHPAFAWGRDRTTLDFDSDEPVPIRRLTADGLLGPGEAPLAGRSLALDDALFARGALIWDRVASKRVRFGDLDIAFDAPMLGIWTKPGARFVCIEPWWGIADPEGFAGEIWDKPGMMRFAPGEARTFAMQVTLAA